MISRRLVSLLVVALFTLPLVLPLATSLEASAQIPPLRVTNIVVSPNGLLGFILNRTVLIAGHPIQGAPVLYFWLSKNPETRLVDPGVEEFLLATIAVGTTPGVVFGTLLVNSTVADWFGAASGTVYLKVTSAKAVNSVAIVSDPFRLQVDVSAALKVFPAHGEFAYYPYFGVSNSPKFLLNLSAIGIGAATFNLNNVDVFNLTLVSPTKVLYAVNRTDPTGATPKTNFLRSPISFGVKPPYNQVWLNGTIGDFSLPGPYAVTAKNGTSFGYQAFSVAVEVKEGNVSISAGAYKVVASRGVGTITSDEYFNFTRVSLGLPLGTVKIFPTVTVSGLPTTPTVGSTFNIELRNFKDGSYTLRIAFFQRQPDYTYVKLPVEKPVGVTVGATIPGFASVSGIEIPDNPYGGRLILITGNVTPGWALASGPTRIFPTLDFVRGFDNNSALASATFAPGEYIFVRGRGFLVETPTFDLLNVTVGVRIPLATPVFTGVFGNGSFAAILQIPVDTKLYTGNTVVLRVYTDAFNNATTPGTVSLGTVRVFVEPRPKIISVFPTPVAGIDLGAARYPYPATWEPEALRRFTLLIYGAPAGATKFNITLSGIITVTVALNVPRTGVGSLLGTFNVPEAPFGDYQVTASTIGVGTWSSSSTTGFLRVSATAAIVSPEFGKRVFLPAPVNVTIRGFGFDRNRPVYFDVPALGLTNVPLNSGPAASPTTATTTGLGSFTGWIDLATIIRAPGVYIIRLHNSPAAAEITVIIGVPPPFTVKVVTGAAKFADLPLDIWVVAFYGGSVARQEQVLSVSVAVYLRVGAETRVFTLTPVVAVPGQAIFYAAFTAPSDALGKDLLVVATATGRFSPIAPTDTAADVASATIPPVRLADIMAAVASGVEAFNNVLAQLTSISNKLDALSAALGTAVTTIRGDIAAVRSDIAEVKALVVEVNTNVGAAIQAILTVADLNNVILGKLDKLNATVVGGVATIRTDVAGLSDLLRSANLTISKLVVDQAGRVIAAVRDSEGRIVGAISANATTIRDLLTAVRSDVKTLSDALATFQKGAFSKLDTIAGSVDAVRSDLLWLKTDLTAAAAVITAIQTTLSEIRTSVGGVSTTVGEIKTTVDKINAAVPNIATKADVSGAQTAITGAIDTAKSDLASRVDQARDTAATSARNWGIINAILIIIAIAILAYATFVARRA